MEREKIKDIQQAKIDELKAAGIDDKYLYELNKKTVSFWYSQPPSQSSQILNAKQCIDDE